MEKSQVGNWEEGIFNNSGSEGTKKMRIVNHHALYLEDKISWLAN